MGPVSSGERLLGRRRYEGTKVRRYEGTKVRRYEGTMEVLDRFDGDSLAWQALREHSPSQFLAFVAIGTQEDSVRGSCENVAESEEQRC